MASPPSNVDLLSNLQFAGLFQRLNTDKEDDIPSATEVMDDYEGKQETLDVQKSASDNGCENNEGNEGDDAGDEVKLGFSELEDVVKNASKGVTEGTDGEYRRSEDCFPSFLLVSLWLLPTTSQMAKCIQFLINNKLIHAGEPFFSATPCTNAPLLITAWIMDGYMKTHTAWKWTFTYHTGIRCDEINLDGSDKAPSIVCNTYAHAQKMRAAMMYTFRWLHGLRMLP